jgi:hypothetical protein
MNESLEAVRSATEKTLVPPAGVPPVGARAAGEGTSTNPGQQAAVGAPAAGADRKGPQARAPADMAERFFATDRWRSPRMVPLAVLLGMFAVGIAGTGLALRLRDASGR